MVLFGCLGDIEHALLNVRSLQALSVGSGQSVSQPTPFYLGISHRNRSVGMSPTNVSPCQHSPHRSLRTVSLCHSLGLAFQGCFRALLTWESPSFGLLSGALGGSYLTGSTA